VLVFVHMGTLSMLVLGPSGACRRELEDDLRDLGHVVVAAEPEPREAAALAWGWDVVVVDARDLERDWRPLVTSLASDGPLLAVTREPRRLADVLVGHPGGIVLMNGDEGAEGRERAVQLCAALRGVMGDDPRRTPAGRGFAQGGE
jgi:hypothetical protein